MYYNLLIIIRNNNLNIYVINTFIILKYTSCGVRHNNSAPCCHLANDNDWLMPVVWAMAGRW